MPLNDYARSLTESARNALENAAFHSVDGAYFGLRSVVPSSPITQAEAIALAPDSSAGAANLLDFFANWRSRSERPLRVQLGSGYYKFDALPFQQNADVFYPASGLEIRGMGSHATCLCALPSQAPSFISVNGKSNWTQAPRLQGLRLIGAGSANPDQVGVFLNPDLANSLGFGGLNSVSAQDLVIHGFAREQLWMRGGAEDFLTPVQYGFWHDVTCSGLTPGLPAVKLTGQIGPPMNFSGLQCYGPDRTGAEPICYVGLDMRAGMVVSARTGDVLQFTKPHRLKTGDRIKQNGGNAWGGMANDTTYWVYLVDEFRLKFSTTRENACANPPVFVPLSGGTPTGTASTFSTAPVAGAQSSIAQLILDTPTFQQGYLGLYVESGYVTIRDMHAEDLKNGVKVGRLGICNIHNAATADAANDAGAGVLFDMSEGGVINLTGTHGHGGTVDKFALSTAQHINSRLHTPMGGFVGQYQPTTGSGIATNQVQTFFQLGNAAELDVGQAIGSEFMLNTGPTVVQNIRAQAQPSDWVAFRALATNGQWVEFGGAGNLYFFGRNYVAGTLRLPADSFVTFILAGGGYWYLDGLQMPLHSAAWVLSGDIAANGTVSKTVTCPGARVGDLRPAVSISNLLASGLELVNAGITADDTLTVRIVNRTGTAIAGPTNPTVYARQVR